MRMGSSVFMGTSLLWSLKWAPGLTFLQTHQDHRCSHCPASMLGSWSHLGSTGIPQNLSQRRRENCRCLFRKEPSPSLLLLCFLSFSIFNKNGPGHSCCPWNPSPCQPHSAELLLCAGFCHIPAPDSWGLQGPVHRCCSSVFTGVTMHQL